MTEEQYNKIIQDITNIQEESPIKSDTEHARRTLKWVLKIKPDADIYLKTAAFGHDIDRGITKITNKDLADMADYDKDRKEHAERSSRFIKELTRKYCQDEKIIEKIGNLVLLHETGGNEEADILRDADSIAYFDYNIPLYIERNGKEKAKFKINYMFDRASKRARDIIKTLKYKDEKIEKIVENVLGEK